MKYTTLEKIATAKNIGIDYYNISGIKGVSVKLKDYHIAINNNLIESEQEKCLILAHELGHCMTDSFFYWNDYGNPNYKNNLQKNERKATEYEYRLLVPICYIKNAIKKVGYDDYAIAEELNISVELLHEIVEYYRRKGQFEL